ncbi:hypothetical protein [Modestobacter excelsi]|uniref:hypothetical protein n=1 Tax=Modestobacter excelsi TaxID=2213161 RepID=UPI00110D1A0D|nr:hypothetical protein [Modestobacter excelsi]
MERDGRPQWDDGRLIGLAVEVLDGDGARRGRSTTSAAPGGSPAELPLADVVAAGRAAYCWLDVIVSLRSVTRHHGPVSGASTCAEPGH